MSSNVLNFGLQATGNQQRLAMIGDMCVPFDLCRLLSALHSSACVANWTAGVVVVRY